MRVIIIVMALVLAVQAGEYRDLVRTVEREFNKKQQEYNDMTKSRRYRWEFVESWNLPWCHDDLVGIQGEPAWVPGYGQIIKACEGEVYVGVKSWIERKDDRSQVVRVFVYRKQNGRWNQAREIRMVQNWDCNVGWVCSR